jgi:V8-like Glu-specific endopeptidase
MKQYSNAPVTTLLNTTVVGQPWQKSFQLGLGVDAITGQLRAAAVKPFKLNPSPQLNPEFIYSLVQSESDLQSIISGSTNAAYNLEGVTLSASASFLDSIAVSELAVTVVAQVSVQESQYSSATKYELDVKPDNKFRDKYGDFFVAGYRAGSSLYAIYQCRFSSAENRSKFTASLAAEVPEVFSAEGSASFEKISKENSASVSIRISAQGVNSPIPTPPSTGWTPESIVSDILPWFKNSISMEPLETYLQHYRLIDPEISGEVPVSPIVFSELSFLYNRFWLVRALFHTCPDFGRRLVEEQYHKLESQIEAYQASLPSEPEKIAQFTEETKNVLQILHEINNRQAFYTQVVAAAKTEPKKGENFDADKGVVRWSYGFQRGNMPGVEILGVNDSVSAESRFAGWNEHVFSYRDSTKVIVGLDLVCNRSDGHNGDWKKVNDQMIGRNSGDVYVKGDYARAYSWSITWYVVNANLYPTGPWAEDLVHVPEFFSAENADDPIEYWTPERMSAARPIDPPTATTDELPDAERSIVGGGAQARGGTDPSEKPAWMFDDPDTSRIANPQVFPYKTVGKLFFTMDGRDCCGSASVVHRCGILTAAHCLLFSGKPASKILFVPAYQNGKEPFGSWAIEKSYWPTSWQNTPAPAWDVGFCTVKTDANKKGVGDVVGWLGVAWGSVAEIWNDMGYPAQKIPKFPFDGQEPWQSLGRRVAHNEPSTIAKWDNFNKGASGGPWVVPGTATVNGVHSADTANPLQKCGPEFGDWVGGFFRWVFPT